MNIQSEGCFLPLNEKTGGRKNFSTCFCVKKDSYKTDNKELYFLYDDGNSVYGFIRKNGTSEETYYYTFNLQGDIIGIIDSTGTTIVEYSYGAWGDILSVTGSQASTIGQLNPLRYRGYYYDSESGYYYLGSRYYDPEIGRFINADGYVSTGQGITGYNMFAYCGNNPVNRVDNTGRFWNEIWEFGKTLVTEIGKAMGHMAPAYAGCGGLAVADGPLPIGDAIAVSGMALITIGAAGYGIYQTAKAPSKSVSKAEEKEKAIAISRQPKRQAYFPINPNDFTPKGLLKKAHSGSYNGRIIEWVDPISRVKIFEWDEDFRYGSHYHAIMFEWKGKHNQMHYPPGTPVPEPWNSIYF